MNIKKLLLPLILLLGTNCFAEFGAGGLYGINTGPDFDYYVAATIRSDESPWCLNATMFTNSGELHATADNWFIYKPVTEPLSWYCFWGISGGTSIDYFEMTTGARFGVGLDWFVLEKRNLEFFCQYCWNPYFGFSHDGEWEGVFKPFCFPFTSGARWWFR